MTTQMSHTLVNLKSGAKIKLEFKVYEKTGLCKVYVNRKLYDESYDAEVAFLAYTSVRFWMDVRIENEFVGPYVDPYYVSKVHQLALELSK